MLSVFVEVAGYLGIHMFRCHCLLYRCCVYIGMKGLKEDELETRKRPYHQGQELGRNHLENEMRGN